MSSRDGKKFETYISLEDLERVKLHDVTWFATWDENSNGYYASASLYMGKSEDDAEKYLYKPLYLHRLILEDDNTKDVVDHIDNDGLNNTRGNLRKVTFEQNSKNRKGRNSNNTSGYRNVSWSSRDKKWIVQLQVNGKNKRLGKFECVHEAGKFAEKMRKKYYGEFAGKS